MEDGRGCSVKDSLPCWIWCRRDFTCSSRRPGSDDRRLPKPGRRPRWTGAACKTPTELEQWSEGLGLDVFVPALLDSDDLWFCGAGSADGAGFALNRSGGVVGVSNVFAGSADLITVWSDLVVVAARMYPGFDLVGYELGADLQAALSLGFVGIGQLRVWMR